MASPASNSSKRPITPEDLFNLPIVSDPRLSPDGTQVAYVVTRLDQDADEYRAARAELCA